MIFLATLLGPAIAGKLLGSKWFMPALRIAVVLLIVAALWIAKARYDAALIEKGVQQERAAWKKLDLETKLANEKTRALRLTVALEQSNANTAANLRLKDMWTDMAVKLAARNQTLQFAREVQLAQLFEPGPDPCRVYSTPLFHSVHDESGTGVDAHAR